MKELKCRLKGLNRGRGKMGALYGVCFLEEYRLQLFHFLGWCVCVWCVHVCVCIVLMLAFRHSSWA